MHLTLFFAFISAPLDTRYWATSKRPRKHALWSAVIEPSYLTIIEQKTILMKITDLEVAMTIRG